MLVIPDVGTGKRAYDLTDASQNPVASLLSQTGDLNQYSQTSERFHAQLFVKSLWNDSDSQR